MKQYGIILLKSMIDRPAQVKAICRTLNLKRINSFAKIRPEQMTQQIVYRLNKFAIWGLLDQNSEIPLKLGLHPIKGGFNKLKKFGYLENFNQIFSNMYNNTKNEKN